MFLPNPPVVLLKDVSDGKSFSFLEHDSIVLCPNVKFVVLLIGGFY